MLFEWFPNDSFVTEGRGEAVLLDKREKREKIYDDPKEKEKIVEEPKEKKKM